MTSQVSASTHGRSCRHLPDKLLILIDEIHLLPALYERVLLPHAVALELRHIETPEKVRRWMDRPPTWLDVHSASLSNDPRLVDLDPGERLECGVTLILMDETKGRHQAQDLQLKVRGTLGVLAEAARLKKIEFLPTLQKLEATTFRMSASVRDAAIKEANL